MNTPNPLAAVYLDATELADIFGLSPRATVYD